MKIEFFLTPEGVSEKEVQHRTVIVIDVLRASSTIVTALAHGARQIIPVPDMATAGRMVATLEEDSYLLAGEHKGVKIEGCQFGNSPLEFTPEAVRDRAILFKTTNGTGAILAGQAATHLVIGSLLNARSVVRFVQVAGLPVTIICAGWRGRVSFEDTVCAGLILHRLRRGRRPARQGDAARIAHALYLDARSDLGKSVIRSEHGRRLRDLGFGADVEYCVREDGLSIVPYYRDSMLKPAENNILKE